MTGNGGRGGQKLGKKEVNLVVDLVWCFWLVGFVGKRAKETHL